MIIAQGANIGGWSLYAKGGKLNDYGSRGNAFNGRVKGVQLAIADAAENSDHLVSPEDAIRIDGAAVTRRQGLTNSGFPANRDLRGRDPQ